MPMQLKSPNETKHLQVSFEGIADGAILTGVEAVSIAKGLASGAALVIAAQVASPVALVSVSGGADGELYRIDVTGTFDDGAVLEASVELLVQDLDWQVPDAGLVTSYIEPTEYFERYSLEETIAVTDRDGSGRLNKTVFLAALADASADIDTALADRYSVPIAPVPRVLKTVAASLARAHLHVRSGNVPEDVEIDRENASKQLQNLAKGVGLLQDAKAPTATSDTPLFEGGGQVFSNDALKGF